MCRFAHQDRYWRRTEQAVLIKIPAYPVKNRVPCGRKGSEIRHLSARDETY
jgi:hypothetical protein